MNNEDDKLKHHPGSVPTSPVIWPADRHKSNQIQQTKGSAKPQASFVAPSTQPSQPGVPPRTTPQHVNSVRVVTRTANGQKTVSVQFNHPGGDAYFAGANVYLKRAGQQPTLVAGGAKSPLTFTVASTHVPHAVYVTSLGNWGETNVLSSPSRRISLK